MNPRLIFQLSLFGLAMAFATVFWIPSTVEPFCWFAIFIFCALLLAKRSQKRFFLSGLLLGLANSVWVTSVHILLFESYVARHPQEAEMIATSPWPDSPRLMMLITGPVIGLISGLILGLFVLIAVKVHRKST